MNRFPTGEAAASLDKMQQILAAPDVTVTYDEGQRQMVMVALAKLAADRPGWLDALKSIALKMDNDVDGSPQMFAALHTLYTADQAVSR